MNEIETFEFLHVIDGDNDFYDETIASAKRRVAAMTGFDIYAIQPMDGDADNFTVGGKRYRYCTRIGFTVNGHGWATDFARPEVRRCTEGGACRCVSTV